MSLRIITGSTGVNHVTSQDDGSLNQGIFGRESAVLDIGNKFAAAVIDNNTIRIKDGDLILQGRHARVNAGVTDDVKIDTGAVDNNRIDLIVARYSLDPVTGYEDISYKVIKGTQTTGTAVDPAYNQGDIRTGAVLVDFPLYRVSIKSINIESVTPMFRLLPAPAYKVSELADNYAAMEQNLTAQDNLKFRFATNGEGKYGYLGADDSFIPFSKGGNLIANRYFSPVGVVDKTYTIPEDGFLWVTANNVNSLGRVTIYLNGVETSDYSTSTSGEGNYSSLKQLKGREVKKGDTIRIYANNGGSGSHRVGYFIILLSEQEGA